MRALVYAGPGQLEIQQRPVPQAAPGDALIKVRYAGICGTDLHLWDGGITGVEPPVVVGHEIVGELAGGGGAQGTAGQRVVVEPLLDCGHCRACREGHRHVCRRLRVLGVHADGGAAEYLSVPADRLHSVPTEVSWDVAACAEPTAVAVHMSRRAGLGLGDLVLVLGGGPIGFLVASVARAAGARRVLVSEISPPRIEFCRRAGLDVIDAGVDDPVEVARDLTDGEGADVVVEAVGHPSAADAMVSAARVGGTVLVGGLYSQPPPVDLRAVSLKELRLVGSRVYESRDFTTALELLATGQVDAAALVTRIVPLERAVVDGFLPLRDSRSEMKVLLAPGG